MITGGRSSGTGTFSYHERSSGNKSVMVSKMPEDYFSVRITFRHQGETVLPLLKISTCEAEMLWACLNSMAQDLKWKDFGDGKEI